MTRMHLMRIDQLGRVVTGKTPASEMPEEFGEVYPFITPSDIPQTQKYVIAQRAFSEKGFNAHKRSLLPPKSVCVVCIGATIGKVCTTDQPSFANQQINSIVPNSSESSPEFVYYLATTLRDALVSFAGGSATPILNKSDFSAIKVLVPEQAAQQKIAAILSAYDDLIANNQRRITLLERMAEDIYREWFVRLRFPGHENVKIEKGVPQGWDVLPFTNVVNINPREKINASAQVPFVPMDELSTSQMYFNVNEYRQHAAGSKFRNNDVLFPRITPSLENGKRGYVLTLPNETVGVGSTEFIVLREQTLSSEHIYFLTCSSEFRKHAELSMTGASGRQRVSEDCFGFLLVKVPPDELRNKFKETVGPYFQQIRLLSESLSKLKATRDSLLPRLISGKLSVDALDIRFPPGMADADA
jgi:type I restriction enzyme, S subunit